MKPTTRRFIYIDDFKTIVEWAEKYCKLQDIRTPNSKFSFPFYLELYLKRHKEKKSFEKDN